MQQSRAFGLYLLFEPGKRPSVDDINAFAASWEHVSVSHNPAAAASFLGNSPELAKGSREADTGLLPVAKQWVELLRDGLTFDLLGLVPEPSCALPQGANRFDWPAGIAPADCEAVRLELAPHLVGGERAAPVQRALVALARDLTLFFEQIVAVMWPPCASLIGRRYFESTATAWLDGGAFPALGLTAFKPCDDGSLESVGLDFWIGQEVRLDPSLVHDRVAGTRLGVRLVNHLVVLGGLASDDRLVGPDGRPLVMTVSDDRKLVSVMRE